MKKRRLWITQESSDMNKIKLDREYINIPRPFRKKEEGRKFIINRLD